MSGRLDLDAIARARASATASGLATSSRPPPRAPALRVPDLLSCVFDPSSDSFAVVYADATDATLLRTELEDVCERGVVAWEIDEFRRGVRVVLEDGEVTSFSAEYPKYLRDPEYRRKVDARTGGGEDLGQRVAQRVRAFREERGWSVAELARRASMAAPNVHRVEAGTHVPSSRTLVRLAEALQVPVGRLVRAAAR